MKKKSVNKLFDQWVEARVLFEAGPDEFGQDAWHQSIGRLLALSEVFLELAYDTTTYQKTYFADCKEQAAVRADEILTKCRARRDEILAAERAAAHA